MTATDLGGTMSLNILVPDAVDAVLRIHARFATRTRIRALQDLRSHLAGAGLVVGDPLEVHGKHVVRAGPYLAELERHVAHEKPLPTWDAYRWLYGAMGRLHRHTDNAPAHVPRPVVATYGPPSSLRRWLRTTEQAVAHDERARSLVEQTRTLLRRLEARWTRPAELPARLVHGDVRLGNVAWTTGTERRDAAYFDFGFAAVRPRIHELAYSLFWIILRPDDSGRAETFAWDELPALVDAYEHGASERLLDVEHQALIPYAAAVPLYLAAVAGYTPDPVATLLGEVPSLAVAAGLLGDTVRS
jgi:Ser/Thr protein kinase RdoA (MazF antagonist)